jgi:hypothetical protein
MLLHRSKFCTDNSSYFTGNCKSAINCICQKLLHHQPCHTSYEPFLLFYVQTSSVKVIPFPTKPTFKLRTSLWGISHNHKLLWLIFTFPTAKALSPSIWHASRPRTFTSNPYISFILSPICKILRCYLWMVNQPMLKFEVGASTYYLLY